MMQGVEITKDCIEAYEDLKLRNKYRYVLLKVTDDKTQVVIDELGGPERTFDDYKAKFKDILSAKDCRITFLDFQFETNGRQVTKTAVIHWIPQSSDARKQYTYQQANDQIMKHTKGCGLRFDWCEESDADYTKLLEEARRKA